MFVISISANGRKVFPFCLFSHRSRQQWLKIQAHTSVPISFHSFHRFHSQFRWKNPTTKFAQGCSRVKTGDKGQQSVECFSQFLYSFPRYIFFLLLVNAFVIRLNGNWRFFYNFFPFDFVHYAKYFCTVKKDKRHSFRKMKNCSKELIDEE